MKAQDRPAWEELLGERTDQSISEEFGVSYSTVRRRRIKKGLPPARRTSALWEERKALLGTAPDAELAARWGCSRSLVQTMRQQFGIQAFRWNAWTDRLPLLGTAPDAELAARWGCSQLLVSHRRRAAGIKPAPCPRPGSLPWEEIDPLLGTMTDEALAEQFNCHSQTIGKRRRNLGITAHRYS